MQALDGHRATIWAVAISPDGAAAVSGSADGEIVFWDLAARAVRCRARNGEGPAPAVALFPDGRFAVSGSGWRFSRKQSPFSSDSDHHSPVIDQQARSEATLAS
jgi:WD40 repeat protein